MAPHATGHAPAPRHTARPDETALTAFHACLDAAVERGDPGAGWAGEWQARERLRISAWVRAAYEHPLAPAALGGDSGDIGASGLAAQCRQARSLALRLEAHGTGLRPVRPAPGVRAEAAVAAVWAVTRHALAEEHRPPRERVVLDAWTVVRELLGPEQPGTAAHRPRARSAW
ncbi:hypothetical protein AB0904_30975 [Streptomyces sp. NPDC006684]|uniref:hypothetical protein n=1 Tax=Streptomyces sp. NPDC006684 TaxID=3154477 RepID=UPI0034569DB5